MVRHIKAGILGGIVLFIWSAVSWMVLPWHMMTIHSFSDNNAVAQSIQANAPTSGIYLLPSPQDYDKSKDQAPQGPMVFSAVHLEGMSPSMWKQMGIGLVSQIISAFFVAWLLFKTKGLGYIRRVAFVVVFALAASIATDVPYWNWFAFDTQYTLVQMADLLIGWFFAGIVMACFTKNN